jgi:hypothetical protein
VAVVSGNRRRTHARVLSSSDGCRRGRSPRRSRTRGGPVRIGTIRFDPIRSDSL